MRPRLDISFTLRRQLSFFCGHNYLPERNEFLLNHNRSGILLALRAARLPAGSLVGVMVYNCHTVMNAIDQAGYKPLFLDVTNSLTLDFDYLKRNSSNLAAIVITHLYGIVNDVLQIREQFPNLLIIEDCAHAYGIDQLYGDFAVFSIGQAKFPSIGDGGILRVLNEDYWDSVNDLYSNLPDYSPIQSLRLFVMLLAKSLIYSPVIYGWLTLPLKKKRSTPSGREPIFPMKMCRGVSNIYAYEKSSIMPKIAMQRDNAKRKAAALSKSVGDAIIGFNGFMLVIRCDKPEIIKRQFIKRGIETDTHFALFVEWAEVFGYQKGQCPNSETLIHHLLMIPTYF